jgi:hypothetical protein
VQDSSLYPISSTLFDQCGLGSGQVSTEQKLNVEISLFSRVEGGGWNWNDFYSISQISSSNVLYSGKFSDIENVFYTVNHTCLLPGCYTASLNTGGGGKYFSKRGRQLSIPECGIYLTPLTQFQSFCIAEASIFNNDAYYFPEGSCTSQCMSSIHIEVKMILFEREGAGWTGSYYFIKQIN